MTSVATISSATLLKEDIRGISIKVAARLDLSKPGRSFRQKVNKIRAGSVESSGKSPVLPYPNISAVVVANVSSYSCANEATAALRVLQWALCWKYQCDDSQEPSESL